MRLNPTRLEQLDPELTNDIKIDGTWNLLYVQFTGIIKILLYAYSLPVPINTKKFATGRSSAKHS
jgi:hypothetical protein